VFYALPRNGEKPGGCTCVERPEAVIVALTILDWCAAKTLVGGFTPSHATVALDEPLGDRAVVDSFDNRARPHWKAAPPRAQDL
jgi:hypothetical protein